MEDDLSAHFGFGLSLNERLAWTDWVSVVKEGLCQSGLDVEKSVAVLQHEVVSDALAVVSVDGEGVKDVLFVCVNSFVITVGVKEGHSQLDAKIPSGEIKVNILKQKESLFVSVRLSCVQQVVNFCF